MGFLDGGTARGRPEIYGSPRTVGHGSQVDGPSDDKVTEWRILRVTGERAQAEYSLQGKQPDPERSSSREK